VAKASDSLGRTAFAMRAPGTATRVSESLSSSGGSSRNGAAALVPANNSSGSITTTTTASASRVLTPAIKPLVPAANRCHAAWQAAGGTGRQALLQVYDARLARFYSWSQTDCSVLLAVHLPTGALVCVRMWSHLCWSNGSQEQPGLRPWPMVHDC
jgi:hypothetical protein